jgi:SAM-dependent methyltransferase
MISASGATRRDRVLDVACGNGSATLAFAEQCAAAVGVDVVPEALYRARTEAANRHCDNALFVLTEIERMAFADNSFSGAICRFSFHHFLNPAKVFAEMARVVAPGAWMMISDMTAPDDPAAAERHNQMERLCDPTHGRALSIGEFEAMFAANGFRTAMKIARDSRIGVDEWVQFGGTLPEAAAELRSMAAAAINHGTPSRFTRKGDSIVVTHTSVSFVIEKES